jgi:demethylmenaquinone methyltransferase/2-methoxy-6-polyprenyl-1,4-benzoquinol methylase
MGKFEGRKAGKNYDFNASLFGMSESFFKRATENVNIIKNAKILDLGCGTGNLTLAIANDYPESKIIGIDISNDQLDYARIKATDYTNVEFLNGSMDRLDFEDESFDLVMSSMVFHGVSPDIRRLAIKEVNRVLKDNGKFLLVDWSKPRLGLKGIIGLSFRLSFILGRDPKDNWNNNYVDIASRNSLFQEHDSYIDSITRKQLFIKKTS